MPENCPKYLYINSPNPEFKTDTIILIFTDEKLKQESIKYLGVWFQGSSFELLHWAAPPHGPTRMGEVGWWTGVLLQRQPVHCSMEGSGPALELFLYFSL